MSSQKPLGTQDAETVLAIISRKPENGETLSSGELMTLRLSTIAPFKKEEEEEEEFSTTDEENEVNLPVEEEEEEEKGPSLTEVEEVTKAIEDLKLQMKEEKITKEGADYAPFSVVKTEALSPPPEGDEEPEEEEEEEPEEEEEEEFDFDAMISLDNSEDLLQHNQTFKQAQRTLHQLSSLASTFVQAITAFSPEDIKLYVNRPDRWPVEVQRERDHRFFHAFQNVVFLWKENASSNFRTIFLASMNLEHDQTRIISSYEESVLTPIYEVITKFLKTLFSVRGESELMNMRSLKTSIFSNQAKRFIQEQIKDVERPLTLKLLFEDIEYVTISGGGRYDLHEPMKTMREILIIAYDDVSELHQLKPRLLVPFLNDLEHLRYELMEYLHELIMQDEALLRIASNVDHPNSEETLMSIYPFLKSSDITPELVQSLSVQIYAEHTRLDAEFLFESSQDSFHRPRIFSLFRDYSVNTAVPMRTSQITVRASHLIEGYHTRSISVTIENLVMRQLEIYTKILNLQEGMMRNVIFMNDGKKLMSTKDLVIPIAPEEFSTTRFQDNVELSIEGGDVVGETRNNAAEFSKELTLLLLIRKEPSLVPKSYVIDLEKLDGTTKKSRGQTIAKIDHSKEKQCVVVTLNLPIQSVPETFFVDVSRGRHTLTLPKITTDVKFKCIRCEKLFNPLGGELCRWKINPFQYLKQHELSTIGTNDFDIKTILRDTVRILMTSYDFLKGQLFAATEDGTMDELVMAELLKMFEDASLKKYEFRVDEYFDPDTLETTNTLISNISETLILNELVTAAPFKSMLRTIQTLLSQWKKTKPGYDRKNQEGSLLIESLTRERCDTRIDTCKNLLKRFSDLESYIGCKKLVWKPSSSSPKTKPDDLKDFHSKTLFDLMMFYRHELGLLYFSKQHDTSEFMEDTVYAITTTLTESDPIPNIFFDKKGFELHEKLRLKTLSAPSRQSIPLYEYVGPHTTIQRFPNEAYLVVVDENKVLTISYDYRRQYDIRGVGKWGILIFLPLNTRSDRAGDLKNLYIDLVREIAEENRIEDKRSTVISRKLLNKMDQAKAFRTRLQKKLSRFNELLLALE